MPASQTQVPDQKLNFRANCITRGLIVVLEMTPNVAGIPSIELIPMLVDHVGWQHAFMALAPGPAFGVLSMLRLRALPEAIKIAGGRR